MPRSTRKKIIEQVDFAAQDIDNALGHLQVVDAMADGRSEYITHSMPILVNLLDECKKVLLKFKQQL